MNITPLTRPVFNSRVKKLEKYATHAEEIQRNVLKHLISEASSTEWGIKHNYSDIKQYEQFVKNVGVQDYVRQFTATAKAFR